MVKEVVLLPEMLEAGLEALKEERNRGAGDADTVIAVFLAMRAIEEIFAMRLQNGAIH